MSSSDKFPDWSVFSERHVPFDVELLSPASEVTALLQRYWTDMNKMRQEIESLRSEGLNASAQQAVYVVQLAAALDIYESVLTQASLGKVHRHLRIIKDQMLSALEKAGLEVNIPVGKPFNEVANVVHVDGWRHHADFLSEVVAEVIEPIVTYRGRLVRMGRVVMGAPPDKVTEQIMTDKVEKT
jgi:molecular chaperone GrpE (heat shock protein)